MTKLIQTCVRITPKQKEIIEQKSINISKFLRNKIEELEQ